MLMMPLVILTMTDDSDREYMEWLYKCVLGSTSWPWFMEVNRNDEFHRAARPPFGYDDFFGI
ncbi:MAG: hypothetical protein RR975_09825 [Clostridia bacterium]